MTFARVMRNLKGGTGNERCGPIGLVLGQRHMHLMQLSVEGERTRIRAAFSKAYPEDRDSLLDSPKRFKKILRPTLDRGGLRGRRVVSALPPEELRLMVLNYEADTDRDEPDQILSLVKERIRESLDECVVDYFPIRTSGDKHGEKSALVAVATESAVYRHLELLRAGGLVVEALEIAPTAVRRLVSRLSGSNRDENVLVLHCGQSSSTLTVLCGRRLISYRDVKFGERSVVESIANALGLDTEAVGTLLERYGVETGDTDLQQAQLRDERGRELADPSEISRTLREILQPALAELTSHARKTLVYAAFQTRGAPVHYAYLLGPPAGWRGFRELLEREIAIPVRSLDPIGALDATAEHPRAAHGATMHDAGLAVAAGLSLRGISDG